MLDAQGIGNAVLQVAQNFLRVRLLLGQFFCPGLHLALQFPFVFRQRRAHLKQRLAQGVVVAQRLVGRFEIAAADFLREFLGPRQPLRQAVHGRGHVANFIRRDAHFAVGQHATPHVQQRALQFFDGLHNASGHNDAQGDPQNHHDPRHAACIHGQFRAEFLHACRAVAEGCVLACRQRRKPVLYAGGKHLELGPRFGIFSGHETRFVVLVALPIRQQTHDFAVQDEQGVGLDTQGVQVRTGTGRPCQFKLVQGLQMLGKRLVDRLPKHDLLLDVCAALLRDPVVDVHERRGQGLVHVLERFQTRHQGRIHLRCELAAPRQGEAREHEQHRHGQDEDPEAKPHAPRDVPTHPLHRVKAFSSWTR